jgi:hypothetical protein
MLLMTLVKFCCLHDSCIIKIKNKQFSPSKLVLYQILFLLLYSIWSVTGTWMWLQVVWSCVCMIWKTFWKFARIVFAKKVTCYMNAIIEIHEGSLKVFMLLLLDYVGCNKCSCWFINFVCWWLVCFFESSNIWVSTYIQQFAIDVQKNKF